MKSEDEEIEPVVMNPVQYWLWDHELDWVTLRARFGKRNVQMWIRNGFRRSNGLGVASDKGSKCRDCGGDPEMYLVKDRLWRKVGMGVNDGLCIVDLEKRLGRPLRRRDFHHASAEALGQSVGNLM
ncbi:MAG: hypothetical protein M3P18_07360 [Actinomycetota bacterium]|nr:hypothetical protein [Actinomycetota bacterium]